MVGIMNASLLLDVDGPLPLVDSRGTGIDQTRSARLFISPSSSCWNSGLFDFVTTGEEGGGGWFDDLWTIPVSGPSPGLEMAELYRYSE